MNRILLPLMAAAACAAPAHDVTGAADVQADAPAWRLTERHAHEALPPSGDAELYGEAIVLVWERDAVPDEPIEYCAGPPVRAALRVDAPARVQVGQEFEAAAWLDGEGGPYAVQLLPSDDFEVLGADRAVVRGGEPARFRLKAKVAGRLTLSATACRAGSNSQ